MEGNLYTALQLKDYLQSLRLSAAEKATFLSAALLLGSSVDEVTGRTSPAWRASLLARLAGKHSRARNRQAIAFHYDVSNDFYRTWLDEQMVYSCAYFEDADDGLDQAQRDKLDHICRKLRLKPGERLLDIGCGWGALIRWAATHYGASAHGITLSRNQYEPVFNRGRHQADLPASVERLLGDRNGQLDELKGRTWDVVIDNPTSLPRWVRLSGEILQGKCDQYVFISTLSVYESWAQPNVIESAKLATTPEPASEDVPKYYGALKALSEQEAEKWYPGKVTVIRPGRIVGPRDETDRFTYWPVRVARGGEILCPGNSGDAAQIIDARDLAEWTIRMVEDRHYGI